MARVNIFVSFEFEKDNSLKNSFYQQAEGHTQHRVRNCSLNREYPDDAWKNRARQAIRECDVVFVLVGQDTHNAPGVLVETDMARSLNKPTIQVLSEKALRNNYTGVPHLEDRIPWSGMSSIEDWTPCRSRWCVPAKCRPPGMAAWGWLETRNQVELTYLGG